MSERVEIGWDDRKALAWLWQDHCQLPEGGLTEQFYDAVIAVAQWGADQEHAAMGAM